MNLLGGASEKGHGDVQDFVRAHMWYNLSSSLDDDGGREFRDRIAKRLSGEDILYAQKLARECQQRQFKDC